MTTPRTTSAAPPKLGRWRRFSIWTLIVVASLIRCYRGLDALGQAPGAGQQILERCQRQRDRRSGRAETHSRSLVNQLYDNVDVAAAIEQRLPEGAKPIAGTLAGALRQPATNAINQLLARPRVQQLFIKPAPLRTTSWSTCSKTRPGSGSRPGKGRSRSTCTNSSPSWASRSGCPIKRSPKIPADAGVISLMKSDQLSALQKGVKLIHVLSAWLLIAVLVLYALAIFLARGHRRETLRNVGWAFAIVGLFLLLIRRAVGNYAIDALASPVNKKPAHDIYLIESSILHQIGIATVAYGLIVVAGAVLAGPTRWATSLRRHMAPTLNDAQAIAWGALAGASSSWQPGGRRTALSGPGGAFSCSPACSPADWSRSAVRH